MDGVLAFGVKRGRNGVALVSGEGRAAAVFTSNRLQAAHIQVTRAHIAAGPVAGVVVTSGNANCATGEPGLRDARMLCDLAGTQLRVPGERLVVASTGVIGVPMDLTALEPLTREAAPGLRGDEDGALAAARSIMTTDTRPKLAAARCGRVTAGGICKGAGMIAPNMGTMIAVLYTDAALTQARLQAELQAAVDETFNMVAVDGDTSPNDTAILIATGTKRAPTEEARWALRAVCRELAIAIASDGEGAGKLLVVQVTGAPSAEEARRCARAIATSPLVKSAVHGADPNLGRVLSAAGNSLRKLPLGKVRLGVGDGKRGVVFFEHGTPVPGAAPRAAELMRGGRVEIMLDLGSGRGEAAAWGCDLTAEYVRINAEYTT